MVSIRARLPVVVLSLLGLEVSVAQQVSWADGQTTPPPPQGSRVRAQNGDTIVIEGEDEVRIIYRRPAFVRIVADADQAQVVVVAEYLKAAGDRPTGLSDRTFAFYNIEGQTEWPLPERWEGRAWLEEYKGTTAREHRAFLGVETPLGDIVLGSLDPTFQFPPARPTTVVRFAGALIDGGKRPFDVAEQETLAAVARNNTGRPIRK